MGRFTNENRGQGVVDGRSNKGGTVSAQDHREKGEKKDRYGVKVQDRLAVNPLSKSGPNSGRGNPGIPT